MKIKVAVDALGVGAGVQIGNLPLAGANGKRGSGCRVVGRKAGYPAATMSFHLKTLTHAKLVKSRVDGRFVIIPPTSPRWTSS